MRERLTQLADSIGSGAASAPPSAPNGPSPSSALAPHSDAGATNAVASGVSHGVGVPNPAGTDAATNAINTEAVDGSNGADSTRSSAAGAGAVSAQTRIPPGTAVVFALHGRLQAEEQDKVLEAIKDEQARKIIFATNLAETSITIKEVHIRLTVITFYVSQFGPHLLHATC